MAASQNSCCGVNLKPICGRRTTRAETRNQTMKAIVRFRVVMVSVRQASLDAPALQNDVFSGSQRDSQVPSVVAEGLRVAMVFPCG